MGPLLFFLLQERCQIIQIIPIFPVFFFFHLIFTFSVSSAVYAEQKSILCLVLSCIPSSQAWQIGRNQSICGIVPLCGLNFFPMSPALLILNHWDSSTSFSLNSVGPVAQQVLLVTLWNVALLAFSWTSLVSWGGGGGRHIWMSSIKTFLHNSHSQYSLTTHLINISLL